MRDAFTALEKAIQDFLLQPDHRTMALVTRDADVIFPINILRNLDRARDDLIILLFPFGCADVGAYTTAGMDLLDAQARSANNTRAEGEAAWPPLPLMCLDPRIPPAQRLEAAARWARDLLRDGRDILWGLLPSAIGDREGYRRLVDPLLGRDGVPDWVEGHYFLIRDDRESPLLRPELANPGHSHGLFLDVDFSTERATDAFARTINDADQPLPARMQALMQVAALDFAHRRYQEAVAKYALLHDYYVQQADPAGQAMAVAGAGDVALRSDDAALAKVRYQQGLAVAVPTGNLGLLLNLLIGAGAACHRLRQYEEAEGYERLASDVAGKSLNPFAKIDAMERLGDAQHRLGRFVEAGETWCAAEKTQRDVRLPRAQTLIAGQADEAFTRPGPIQ